MNGHLDHAHLSGCLVSRREFIGTAAGALGAALSAGLWVPAQSHAADMGGAMPKPIPGGVTPPIGNRFIHHFPAVPGKDMSQITDFKGLVTRAKVAGNGTGTDKRTGAMSRLLFECDSGVHKGTYVGVDGKQYRGTFGFI